MELVISQELLQHPKQMFENEYGEEEDIVKL